MIALLAVALLQTPASSMTMPPAPAPRADSVHAPAPPSLGTPVARVTFDFGTGAEAPIPVRSLEMSTEALSGPIQNRFTSATRVRFVRAPGALTSELSRRVSTGERIAEITVELAADSGAPMIVAKLYDVQVTGDRLVMHGAPGDLEQQRIALEEGTVQLDNELAEARRQQVLAESLDKRKLSSTAEVSRAREQAEMLGRRRDMQRARLDLVQRNLARWMPLEEEVTLTAARTEVGSRE